jgi:hypothetical protein
MSLTVDFSYLVGITITIVGAFWAMAKLLLSQSQSQIKEQFELIQKHMQAQDEHGRRLEREVLELKAVLPRDYVRREDYTQAIATIMTKLDAMAMRFENVLLRASHNQ